MGLSLQDLAAHMKQYKDALIIVGPAAAPYHEAPPAEELMARYSAKAFRRQPETFWPFFWEHIFVDPDKHGFTPAYEAITRIAKSGLTSKVVTQTVDGLLRYEGELTDVLPLHGDALDFVCLNPSCKTHFTHQYVQSLETAPECEVCGRILRPNVLLFGEKYRDTTYEDFKMALIQTHTLILIGLDYSEDMVTNLIADFLNMKTALDQADKRMAIAIGEAPFDLNEELGFFEFIVPGDPGQGAQRLADGLR